MPEEEELNAKFAELVVSEISSLLLLEMLPFLPEFNYK